MIIDDDLLSHLTKLSKLELEGSDRDRILEDLKKILAMVEKLKEVEVTNVEPMVYPGQTELTTRPDEVSDQLDRSAALQNAPEHDGKHFLVPRVIE